MQFGDVLLVVHRGQHLVDLVGPEALLVGDVVDVGDEGGLDVMLHFFADVAEKGGGEADAEAGEEDDDGVAAAGGVDVTEADGGHGDDEEVVRVQVVELAEIGEDACAEGYEQEVNADEEGEANVFGVLGVEGRV